VSPFFSKFLLFACVLLLSTVAAADLTQGVVGYWKLDENSGSFAADPSLNDNTVSLHGANGLLEWISGKVGAAWDMDALECGPATQPKPPINLRAGRVP
jgi:hypothetical protein